VLATAVFATLASSSSAPAATLASRQEQARRLDEQVSRLEVRYDQLQERYRGAQYELEQVRRDVAAAHKVVVATRHDLGVAKIRLADRADAIYRTGGTGSELTELATAGSFSGFFERMDTLRRVGDQDANVLERVEQLNQLVEQKERTLRRAKVRAASAAARASRDRAAMGKLLASRQAKLDSVNADIRAIMEAQRRQAAAAKAAAARETVARLRTEPKANDDGSGSGGSSGSSGTSSSPSIPLPPGSSTAAAAANAALSKVGSPYVWAAAGPDSFDCSGLVVWAFGQAGRPGLPHSTYSLVTMGISVPLDQLQVGDLVFPAGDGHVGIYVGGGNFVHAPHTGDVVKVTSLSDYSMDHARRI
jgi:cell wall-associated NlpC family hydrolase